MADPLLELLQHQLGQDSKARPSNESTALHEKYFARLLSLRPSDLTTTEPQSLQQSLQSNLLSIQALSSRSHRPLISSSDQLSGLQDALPLITRTTTEIRNIIPPLDESAVDFAATYSRARDTIRDSSGTPNPLATRKESATLANEADKLQDILELPDLLSSAVAAASATSTGTNATTSTTSSANYTLALDLYGHIKRLQTLYPHSTLIASIQPKADAAISEMTSSLLTSLRAQNLRVAAAIRTIGWLRRVVPELADLASKSRSSRASSQFSYTVTSSTLTDEQREGSYGALFLAARLSTFLNMTEVALAPLRDLADQESSKRLQQQTQPPTKAGSTPLTGAVRRATGLGSTHGTQTERYLKRYIEIFREQSFGTIQMFRNIFPQSSSISLSGPDSSKESDQDILKLPSALASFPLHLTGLLMETLQTYLPNVTDPAARESLLVQVLYASGSLGRLGCDFSLMISQLDLGDDKEELNGDGEAGDAEESSKEVSEPEWYRIIQKHRVQAARLDAMAGGVVRRVSGDVAVR